MKRWIYIDTLQLLHSTLGKKTIISKTSLQQTLRTAYLAKERFSEDEADLIADMLADLKRQNAIKQKATQAQNQLDGRIKGSLLDGSETAIDGRAEKIQFDGGDSKWASK